MPHPNSRYRKHGYLFIVDHVANGQVYVRRFRDGKGVAIRVGLEVWRREMEGVEAE